MANVESLVRTLDKRIATASTIKDMDAWWLLALCIDAALEVDADAPDRERQAARAVLWAVSDAIRAAKRNGHIDHRLSIAAVRRLKRLLKGTTASMPNLIAAPAGARIAMTG